MYGNPRNVCKYDRPAGGILSAIMSAGTGSGWRFACRNRRQRWRRRDAPSAPANILPTDSRLLSPVHAAQRATLAVKVLVSGLVRDSGHSLKVATRVRIPLGLLEKVLVNGIFDSVGASEVCVLPTDLAKTAVESGDAWPVRGGGQRPDTSTAGSGRLIRTPRTEAHGPAGCSGALAFDRSPDATATSRPKTALHPKRCPCWWRRLASASRSGHACPTVVGAGLLGCRGQLDLGVALACSVRLMLGEMLSPSSLSPRGHHRHRIAADVLTDMPRPTAGEAHDG
jgi:hypothetical protein